jgi:hypothetical protein
MPTFERLYGATPFDPEDRQHQIGEAARRALLDAAMAREVTMLCKDSADLPHLLGGLLVGLVQIVQVATAAGDTTDAAIRASIIQSAPWAVDMARAIEGKEPLSNA